MKWWQHLVAGPRKLREALRWSNLVAWSRARRGEITIKDALITENGGKSHKERQERQKLIKEIKNLIPQAYAMHGSTFLLEHRTIWPIEKIRRPRKVPFMFHNSSEAIVRLTKSGVDVAILDFESHKTRILCAFTADGVVYRHYTLNASGRSQQFWMPLYDINKSNVSSSVLLAVKQQLTLIVTHAT